MSNRVTLKQVEQQVSQLPPQEQLKLIAHISEQLSIAPLDIISEAGKETLRQQRERKADELIALCDAAAEMWEGEFDVDQEIRQIRQKRDEQIC